MSKINSCPACNALKRGLNSKIAFKHTCGKENYDDSQSPKCYNCKFAGKQFKINGKTHLHCLNKELYPEKDFESGKLSPWDTLMEWWDTCEKHEYR